MWNTTLGQTTQVSGGADMAISPVLLCNLLALLWAFVAIGFACAHVRLWRDGAIDHVSAIDIKMIPIVLLACVLSFVLRFAFVVGPRPAGWPWPAMVGSFCLALAAATVLGVWRSDRLLAAAVQVAAFIAAASAFLGMSIVDLPAISRDQRRPDLQELGTVCTTMFLFGMIGLVRAAVAFCRQACKSARETMLAEQEGCDRQ